MEGPSNSVLSKEKIDANADALIISVRFRISKLSLQEHAKKSISWTEHRTKRSSILKQLRIEL